MLNSRRVYRTSGRGIHGTCHIVLLAPASRRFNSGRSRRLAIGQFQIPSTRCLDNQAGGGISQLLTENSAKIFRRPTGMARPSLLFSLFSHLRLRDVTASAVRSQCSERVKHAAERCVANDVTGGRTVAQRAAQATAARPVYRSDTRGRFSDCFRPRFLSLFRADVREWTDLFVQSSQTWGF